MKTRKNAKPKVTGKFLNDLYSVVVYLRWKNECNAKKTKGVDKFKYFSKNQALEKARQLIATEFLEYL